MKLIRTSTWRNVAELCKTWMWVVGALLGGCCVLCCIGLAVAFACSGRGIGPSIQKLPLELVFDQEVHGIVQLQIKKSIWNWKNYIFSRMKDHGVFHTFPDEPIFFFLRNFGFSFVFPFWSWKLFMMMNSSFGKFFYCRYFRKMRQEGRLLCSGGGNDDPYGQQNHWNDHYGGY